MPQQSQLWPLVGVVVTWLMIWPTYWTTAIGEDPLRDVFALAIILSSLALLWLDARNGIRSGELQASRPIYIVLAILLFWLLLTPVYVAYRLWSRRGKPASEPAAG